MRHITATTSKQTYKIDNAKYFRFICRKNPGRTEGFFLLRSFLLWYSHDKILRPLVFIHVLIIIDYYVLKYQIDLPDYIFSSLKLYCKKNLMLLWNVLSLIIRVSSQQGTILSQKQWSFPCSWQNFIVKCIWALRWRDRSTSCLPLE